MECSLTWIMWSVPVFLILTRVPRQPRTALSRRDQFIRGMTPVAVSILTVSLACLLAWILLTRLNSSSSVNPTGWVQGSGFLFLLAATGVGLLPHAFSSNDILRTISLNSATRFAAGLAWASCWTGAWESARTGNPTLFLLAAACSLLPDSLDQWVARYLFRTHIHIVPDPLLPDTPLIAETLAMAIARCREQHKDIRLQVYPGQNEAGQWHQYTLRFDNEARLLVVGQGRTSATAPLPCVISTDHPFTLETGKGPLSIRLKRAADGRIRLCVNPDDQYWSHSLVIAAGLGVIAGLTCGPLAGIIAGGAYALHLVCDQLGFTGSVLLFPFTSKRSAGAQLLLPSRLTPFNVSVIWLALLLICWNGARTVLPATDVPSLVSVILLAGALPLALLMSTSMLVGGRPILKSAGSRW
jgi:hypothetical protein